MECDCHMILNGNHIPKAIEMDSDQGFGHDCGCDLGGAMGPSQVCVSCEAGGMMG